MDFKIETCIEKIKQREVCIVKETRAIVYYRNKRVCILEPHWHTTLSEDDFIYLYKNQTFALYMGQDFEISNEKDQEYYAWRNKYL